MAQTQLSLLNYFSGLLNPSLFEDLAPNGLQVEGRMRIERLAFSVSATQHSINEAIKWNADGLVAHHGIFWKHQGSRPITGAWGERVKLCVKNDLNLFAYHLPLDAHAEIGNAVSLGKELGLINFEAFGLYKNRPLGAKGKLPVPLKASELKAKLQTLLGHEIKLASPDETKLISTIGIITGGANNEWSEALKDGLDAYVTGEISEYNWHDSIEAGIHYFAGGHHATEKFGIIALMEKVKKDFPQIEVIFFDSENLA